MIDPKMLAQALLAPKSNAVSPQQLAFFIGPHAQTYDRERERQFLDAEAKGANANDNWKANQTFRDGTGIWQEIPDNTMQVKPDATGFYPAVVNHPQMYQAYPQLQDHTIKTETPGFFGLQEPFGWNRGSDTYINAPAGDPMRSTGVHETQHKIDNIEGVPYGAPITGYDVRRPGDFLTPEGYKEYLAKPMEIRARAAARRLNMTPEERAATLPLVDMLKGAIGGR